MIPPNNNKITIYRNEDKVWMLDNVWAYLEHQHSTIITIDARNVIFKHMSSKNKDSETVLFVEHTTYKSGKERSIVRVKDNNTHRLYIPITGDPKTYIKEAVNILAALRQ